MNAFDLPYLTYADVKQAAQDFLTTYHPTLELPIPIDDIIDVNIGLHIFPFPRLYKDFHLNGFLSYDRTIINVDETQYHQFYPKYRYTLAHELGHYILHRSCYDQIQFSSPDEFVKWKLSVPQKSLVGLKRMQTGSQEIFSSP